jgi:hypothetical protein
MANTEKTNLDDCSYDNLIFLDRDLDSLSDRDAKLLLRKSIWAAKEVLVITSWHKERILDAILSCANPIDKLTWGEENGLTKVLIRRNFP